MNVISAKKEFSRKESLVQHFRTVHLEEKPYGCKECRKWYTIISGCGRHLRKFHEKQLFPGTLI